MKSIYYKKGRLKIALLITAILIGIVSLWYTSLMVDQISLEEKKRIELWASAIAQLGNDVDFNCNQNFLFEVIESNANIPVILTDSTLSIISSHNISSEKTEDSVYMLKLRDDMMAQHDPILVQPYAGIKNYVFYQDSVLLYKLRYYPIFQLAVIFGFLLVSYIGFSMSRRYEQDFVWVGMAKETAHQLGTPISSLVAWHEYMKLQTDPEDEMLLEVKKDIDRLEMITERFSKIGSVPELTEEDLRETLEVSLNYLKARTPKRVEYRLQMPDEPVLVKVNRPLFAWVVENLTKNAIDAMNGTGIISVRILVENNHAIIEFSDTGKGIPASDFKKIFNPGITSKKRGWGLGLSLVKRIMENYHKGKIFVKTSEIGKGTTFKIVLPL